MAHPPHKRPDRHYNFDRMNMWFAISAVLLLAVTVWMVYQDYSKPWKRFQAEFRDLERQQLAAEAERERESLNEGEIAQLQQEIKDEEAKLEADEDEIEKLQSSHSNLGKQVYAADARSRNTKSLLDTERYKYERALQGGNESTISKTREKVESLSRQLREDRKSLEGLTEQQSQVAQELSERRSALVEAETRLEAMYKGVDNLEQRIAGLDKKLDYYLLNAPLLDFVQPDLKIEQVMLSGLYQDINFTRVDRVDRCVTCHLGATRAGYDGERWEAPYRSHPRLDLFVGSTSPHPYTEFGCSSCHGGLDRATDFARVGHSPSDDVQREEWIEKWGWEEQPFLDTPIYPAEYSESGCGGCHAPEVWTPEARVQDLGSELVVRFGCWVCHKIDYPAYEGLGRPGPSLAKVAGKVDPAWAYKWIEAPREFRPSTWMPHFFFQHNTTSEENLERQKAEIASLVAYIWDKSESPEFPSAPPGDIERGEELFESVGCTGCHLRDPDAVRDQFYPQFNRMHGPNLTRLGSKVTSGWVYQWIKDPKSYNPDSRMPSLRLSDREAADITAYLMSSRDPAFENLSMPEIDASIRDELVLDYFQNNLTIEQSQAKLDSLSPVERDVYLGEETVQKYGCWGCHELEGFEKTKPIGVELTEVGSKPLHQFDFGHVHDVPHTRQDWMRSKMLDPRIWDEGKEEVKHYGELYRMPNFGMSEREARAVVTAVLGFSKESVLTHRRAGQSTRAAAIAEGRKLIDWYNCRGCHLVEGDGHAINTAIEDVGMLPPNLAAEGARVQSDWLFRYLHDPGATRLRPWLGVRMPTFGFDDRQVNTLVGYFGAREAREAFLSQPERPAEGNLVMGEVAFTMFQCGKCHPAGPQAGGAGVVSAGELAPSLLLARGRLRHDWVPSWIRDPQGWIAGTKMPANFPKSPTGTYSSPLAAAIDAPMFSHHKERMMRYFDSDEDLKTFLADADNVTEVLRDHIWWNLQ